MDVHRDNCRLQKTLEHAKFVVDERNWVENQLKKAERALYLRAKVCKSLKNELLLESTRRGHVRSLRISTERKVSFIAGNLQTLLGEQG